MKKILVGVDGSETSKKAAGRAVELAHAFGGEVRFVIVVDDDDRQVITVAGDEWEISNLDSARSSIEQFVDSLGLSIEFSVGALEGAPAKALISEAERINADLIVVGNVRMQGIGRLLGSVGNSVAHNAPCDVLIVKTV